MAIVSIEEVTQSTGFDAVNDNLLGNESSFGYSLLKYPLDLGSPTKNHYVVFFINQQNQTQFGGGTGTVQGVRPTAVQNRIDAGTSGNLDAVLNPAQATTRTSGAICLYMPDTLAFDNSQVYSDINLGANMGAALVTGALTVAENMGSALGVKGIKNPSSSVLQGAAGPLAAVAAMQAAEAIGQGSMAQAALQSLIGVAMNPMMELIYSSPRFREYRFDFLFYPRSSAESEAVQKIVELFKFHFSPEILKSSNGFFLVPPSQFDIKFYYNGAENPNIEKTTTCVMTSLNCDYAPNGWAAYEVPGSPTPSLGKTGSPVAIRLSMGFKEIEYKTKEHYKSSQYAFLGSNFASTFFGAVESGNVSNLNPNDVNAFLNQVGFQG